MKKYRIEFNTTEYFYTDAMGLADAFHIAKTYENSTRIIEDIERIK